jgi:CRP-like cAMP-binding protein
VVKVRFDRSKVIGEPNKLRDMTAHFAAGATIFREGDPAYEMFIIQLGEVMISRSVAGVEQRLAILEKGDFFGEMALLEQYPARSATATAVTEVEVLKLDSVNLEALLRSKPMIALRMMGKLSERVREANRRLHEATGRAVDVTRMSDERLHQGVEAWAALHEPKSRRSFFIRPVGETTIGRHDPVSGVTPDVELTALDPRQSVSRRHATIVAEEEALTLIESNASTNGTFLNGERLTPFKPYRLADGDLVQVALVPLYLRILSHG